MSGLGYNHVHTHPKPLASLRAEFLPSSYLFTRRFWGTKNRTLPGPETGQMVANQLPGRVPIDSVCNITSRRVAQLVEGRVARPDGYVFGNKPYSANRRIGPKQSEDVRASF